MKPKGTLWAEISFVFKIGTYSYRCTLKVSEHIRMRPYNLVLNVRI
jgi:hypothetical protein